MNEFSSFPNFVFTGIWESESIYTSKSGEENDISEPSEFTQMTDSSNRCDELMTQL